MSDNMKNSIKKVTKRITSLKSKYFFLGLLIVGIALMPVGIVFGTDYEMYTDDDTVDRNFSQILMSVKRSQIKIFEQKLAKMKDDPLDGLYEEEMPTAEEIFYSEWANDMFPNVDIPIIGSYIEEIGREKIGDIDLDHDPPYADLNITSSKNPSGLNLMQCKALWDPQNEYSFLSNHHIWLNESNKDIGIENEIIFSFNLTNTQFNMISTWLIIGKSTWIRYLSREEIIVLNPLIFFGLLVPGIVLSGYSAFKLRNDIKNIIFKRKEDKGFKKSKKIKS